MIGKNARDFHHTYITFNKLKQALSKPVEMFQFPESKTYFRASKIALSPRTEASSDLAKAITTRYTASTFTDTTLALQAFSDLIDLAVGLRDRTNPNDFHRHYPSGGALYPLEMYLMIEEGVVDKIEAGIYHYNVQQHTLETIGADIAEVRKALFINQTVPITICLSAVWDRTLKKYDDFGYKLVMLEAGHAAQNIILAARELGLQSWPFAHFDEQKVHAALDLALRNEEDVIYCIGLGYPTSETGQSQP